MPLISRLLRLRSVTKNDVVTAYNRELVPLLEQMLAVVLTRIGVVTNITGDYLANSGDGHIMVDASLGPVVITLPDATTTDNRLTIHKKDDSTNAVTITDGTKNFYLISPDDSVDLYPSTTFGWVMA